MVLRDWSSDVCSSDLALEERQYLGVREDQEPLGVDIKPQPNYPLSFIQTDALQLDPKFIASFDAVHASPPCQSYSDLAKRNAASSTA